MSKRVSTIQPRAQANKTTSRRNTSNPPTPKGNQPSGSSAPAPPTAPPPSFASSLPPLPTLPGTPPSIDGSSSIPFSNLIVRSTAHPIVSSAPSSLPSPMLIQPPSTVVSPAPTPPVIISAPESRPPSPPPSHTPVPLPAPVPRRSPRFVTLQQTPASVTLLRALKGQTLAKRVRLLGKPTGSYGKPLADKVSLVLRWTSKLGCCLTRQSKRSCSEATTEKTISDKSSTENVRGVPQRNNEVKMNE